MALKVVFPGRRLSSASSHDGGCETAGVRGRRHPGAVRESVLDDDGDAGGPEFAWRRGGEVREPNGPENGSFFAELNGFNVHYEVHGHGPAMMVVSNSWGIDVAGLRAIYRPLEERLAMVYFDPRGMGQSGPVREDADMGLAAVRADFDALRRHLGLARVHAIGWSNGAMNLVLLASEHPATLASAVFLHGAASYTEEDYRWLGERYPELTRSFRALEAELEDESIPTDEKTARMRRVWLEEFFPVSCARRETAQRMLAEAFRNAQFSWRHAKQAPPTIDARDRLGSITAPSLIIAGRHDTMPVRKAEAMRDGIPDAQLIVLERSGHFAPLEEPQAFCKAVFDFLGV
jgi:proline iminopeptidase